MNQNHSRIIRKPNWIRIAGHADNTQCWIKTGVDEIL